jgi:hypothetical protein
MDAISSALPPLIENAKTEAAATTAWGSSTAPLSGLPLSRVSDDFGFAPNCVPSLAADPLIGADCGGVRIERLIAEGGMGRVYEGIRSADGRRVADKFPRVDGWRRADERRFRREAAVLATLEHPGIPRILGTGVHQMEAAPPWPFIVMELVAAALPITAWCRERGGDGGPELVIRGEHPWLVSSRQAMPVLPRWRHEIGQPVQEAKRRECDDAVSPRPGGLPAAAVSISIRLVWGTRRAVPGFAGTKSNVKHWRTPDGDHESGHRGGSPVIRLSVRARWARTPAGWPPLDREPAQLGRREMHVRPENQGEFPQIVRPRAQD